MRPNNNDIESAHSSGGDTDDTEKQGEITIKHEQPTETAPTEPDKTKQADEKDQIDVDKSTDQPEPGKVIVPGGVSDKKADPSRFFRSNYDRSSADHAAASPSNAHPALSTYPSASQLGQTNGKRKLLIIAAGAAFVVLLIIGYIFGVYVPSKPENVYASGLDRSGKALESFIEDSIKKDQLEKLKTGQVNGSFNATFGKETFKGTADWKYTSTKADLKFDATSSVSGEADQTYSGAILLDRAEGAKFPTAYVKAKGLDFLNLEQYVPGLNGLNDKWITIEESYFKKFSDQYSGLLGQSDASGATKRETPSVEDAAELAQILTQTTKEYVLTKSADKAVLKNKRYVGKEKVDGVDTFHYEVEVVPANYAAYCKALFTNFSESNVYKKIAPSDQESRDQEKATAEKDCDDSSTSIGQDQKLDLWVNTKYKLVHKIRATDTKKADTYYEFGQNYKGGDDVSFFVNFKDGESKYDGSVTIGFNTKTNLAGLDVKVTSSSTDEPGEFTLNLSSKPLTGEFAVTKPAGAITLQEAGRQIGIDVDALLNSAAPVAEPAETGQEF